MQVQGTFSVTCDNCGTLHDIPANEADFDTASTDERQMGVETGYSWESEFKCDCGNDIDFTYEVWEYPAGAFNMDEIKINGGTEADRYSYDFHS